jgi:hypothetical protein
MMGSNESLSGKENMRRFMMQQKKSLTRALLLLVSLTLSSLLIFTACAGEVTTQDIQGILQSMEGREMIIRLDDGTTVRITVETEQTAAEAQELLGEQVKLKARVENGTRQLLEVERRGPEDHFSGVIQSMSADEWVIGGRTFQVNTNTRLDEGLTVGVMARVEAVVMLDGTLLATEIQTENEEDFRLSGIIESMGVDEWVIGGRVFQVNDATRFDEGLVVGVIARVEFLTMPDGTMLATEIETDNNVMDQNRFSGIIESMSADEWIVGERTFQVNVATRLEEGLAVGVMARVKFMTMLDGKLLATRIQVDNTGSGNQREFNGLIESMGTDEWIVGGRTIKVNAVTRLEEGLAEGVTARVEFITMEGAMLATRIRVETSGRVSGGMPTAAETRNRFSGVIESISDDIWVIGGRTFKVTEETMLDEGLAVGVMARVEFMTMLDGTMLATEIETDIGEDIHFSGVIESIGTDAWVIGGRVFKVNADTILDEGLAIGVMARVKFVTMVDGSLLAIEIETDEDKDSAFSGTIESIGADVWVIGGRVFKVDDATMLDEGLAVGIEARIDFITLPDGTLLATEIETDVGEDLHFSGVIESIEANTWVIGGHVFKVDNATILDEGLAVGVEARVEFVMLPDGTMLATEIETDMR